MMKLIFFSMSGFSFLVVLNGHYFIQIMLMILMILFLLFSNLDFFSYFLLYNVLGMDLVSYILEIMLIWMIFMVILASLTSLSLNSYMILNSKFMFKLLFLFMVLFMVFISTNLFMFYVMFELSLIPMFLMVMGWGVQYDRVEAGFYMLVYTFFFSFPLFISLIYLEENYSDLSFIMNLGVFQSNFMIFFLINLSFMVKLPIYSLHLWLPKAHVEASIGGSMILAAVMLKLGSYGILRFMFKFMDLFNSYHLILLSLSLVGSFLTSLICIRQMDLKILVAYSSIVHMGILLGGMLSMMSYGLVGALIMMFSHGFCSSGMFVLVNLGYERFSSRSLFFMKGLMSIFPNLAFLWFIISVNNMASPPSLSLFAEFFLLVSVISISKFNFIMLMSLIMFFSSCYSIYFYSYTQYGMLNLNTHVSSHIYVREFVLLLMHILPLNFLFLLLLLFIF